MPNTSNGCGRVWETIRKGIRINLPERPQFCLFQPVDICRLAKGRHAKKCVKPNTEFWQAVLTSGQGKGHVTYDGNNGGLVVEMASVMH